MRSLPIVAGALALATAAFAAEDPVAVRQTLMDANGSAAALGAGVMKDEIAYSPAIGNAVIGSFAAAAAAFGSFFPEGSGGGDSTAAPKIWEDPAGFQSELEKFATAANAARAAAGKEGPADKAAFVAAVQPVFDTCKSCHETYRIRK